MTKRNNESGSTVSNTAVRLQSDRTGRWYLFDAPFKREFLFDFKGRLLNRDRRWLRGLDLWCVRRNVWPVVEDILRAHYGEVAFEWTNSPCLIDRFRPSDDDFAVFAQALTHAKKVSETTLLAEPEVQKVAAYAFAHAHGDPVANITCTFWRCRSDVLDGQRRVGSWRALAELFEVRGSYVVPDGGKTLVYNPTSNSDGHRCNESTEEVYAAIFDCDGGGSWDRLAKGLALGGYACIFHESRNHSADEPRWRVVLPLSRPFDVRGHEKREQWKRTYHLVRVMLSALAGLPGHGFDPRPCFAGAMWHFGTRRGEHDLPRRVIWTAGSTLDLDALVGSLPVSLQPWNEPVAPKRSRPARTREVDSDVQPTSDRVRPFLWWIFQEVGSLGPHLGDDRWAVRCIANDRHTNPAPLREGAKPTSSTVIFCADSYGRFFCSHSHCGSKTLDEVKAAFSAIVIERAEAKYQCAVREAIGLAE